MSALSEIVKDFDPRQPRDRRGRWTRKWLTESFTVRDENDNLVRDENGGYKREDVTFMDKNHFDASVARDLGIDTVSGSPELKALHPTNHSEFLGFETRPFYEGSNMKTGPAMLFRETGSIMDGNHKREAVPLDYVYRGVTAEEYEQAKERGFIQSDQRGVIIEGVEGTNAGHRAGTAISYLPREGESYVLKIRVDEEDEWFSADDSYYRTRKRIPFDRVEATTKKITMKEGKVVGYGKRRNSKIAKGFNVKWDGDGLQGVGQPRDAKGRWTRLPGASAFEALAQVEVGGEHLVVRPKATRREKDDDTVVRRFKTAKGAENFINREAAKDEQDSAAYRRAKRESNARAREAKAARTATSARRRQEAENEQRPVIEEARTSALREVVPTPEKKPAKSSVNFTESTTERMPVPGKPSMQQTQEADRWAKQNLKPDEAKYAGLITRLLRNKGITQDPAQRGSISDKYGISPKRQVEIENAVYDQMFPKRNQPKAIVPNLGRGLSPMTPEQRTAMLAQGARKGIVEPDPDQPFRPKRMFKATKGPNRGKFVLMDARGNGTVMSDEDAANMARQSKVYWAQRFLTRDKAQATAQAAYREEQRQKLEDSVKGAKQQKEQKINIARDWARKNGFDEEDSFWWGFYWNDPSLMKAQQDEVDPNSRKISVGPLSDVMDQRRMDPKLLEGLLALPDDFDTRKMRGHRPDGPQSRKGDDDFVEAKDIKTDPEADARHADRVARHERRKKAAADRRANPRRVRKSKNPLWDGDGVQGIGQPRGERGRWSRRGSSVARAAQQLGVGQVMQRTDSKPTRAGASEKAPKGTAGNFDTRKKSIADGLTVKKPQKGSTHLTQIAGEPIPRKTKYTPEQAYFHRNNGPKKITNARLKAIYEDRSKITQDERDLISSASADARFDGLDDIRVAAVRAGGQQRVNQRYVLMKNLKTQIGQDYAKKEGKVQRGAGGQVLLHDKGDARAQAQRDKDNKKRAENGRNKISPTVRAQMLSDFGDGAKAKCIFCGKNVGMDGVSPERMKPGPIKGEYVRGNIAPAHVSCNTKMGTAAQHNPEKYYDDMMKQFLKIYGTEIQKGRLGFVFQKHRGKLQGKRPVRRAA